MKDEVSKGVQESPGNVRYIRCPDCGEEIMMVPVLGQMIENIENHIATHKVNSGPVGHDVSMPHLRVPNLEENLAEQVLTRAAEISDCLGKNQTWVNHR